MRSTPLKWLVLPVALTLLPACMLTRAVDRAFVGLTVRKPNFVDRKVTGAFLMPFTFVIDVATFPIQAILMVIFGDNFPFTDAQDVVNAVSANDHFQKLTPEQQRTAVAELDGLLRSGQLTATSSLSLTSDGHWVVMQLSTEQHQQLLARAQSVPQPNVELACR
jgi:hypothetical protein